MLLWAAGAAFADPPNKLAKLWDINPTTGDEVERMAVSWTGNVVVGRTRGDFSGWVLDVDQWVLTTFKPDGCDVTGVAVYPLDTGDEELWTSCKDGSVHILRWNGTAVVDGLDAEGNPLAPIEGIADSLAGIWVDDSFTGADPLMYALHAPETGALELHVIDPADLRVDEAVFSSYPLPLNDNGFVEAVVSTTGQLIVAHGGENVTWLQLGTDASYPTPSNFTGRIPCVDLAASPNGGAFCVGVVGTGGAAAEFRPQTNLWYPLPLGELPDPNAICANLERDAGGNLVDGWLAITGLQVKVWEMNADGTFPSTTPYFEGDPDADNQIQDMVTDDGYLFGGGVDGRLHIVTARPWVHPANTAVTPQSARDGETVTVTFSADEPVDWVLNLGGSRAGGGKKLASGKSDTDEIVEVQVEVNGDFEEGNNLLYVLATNADGLTGHGRATLNVDNPPQPPKLTNANLKFADGALILEFEGIDDADLDPNRSYEVWVSQTPFTGAEYPKGGPPFDGTTSLKTPLTLKSAPGAHVSHRIQPLENDVTYYVGVHAFDAEGKEGPMSTVISGMPRETFTAGQLAGETGGAPCSTGPGSASWWLVGAAAGALAGRRSRRRMAGGAAVATLGVLLLGSTEARADEEEEWWKADATPAHANFEIRYGVISLADPRINNVYRDNAHNMLTAEIGPQIFRFAEVDLGFGFFQELAYTVTRGDFIQSGDRTMLTWWPLYTDVTLRGHLLDEQPVVPFFRYGWDYVIYSELSDNATGSKDKLRGAKTGTHAGLGVNLLLDLLQPSRASFLEARTGINDSWLTIEWRTQAIDGRKAPWAGPEQKGFDFSGNTLQVGVKLDW